MKRILKNIYHSSKLGHDLVQPLINIYYYLRTRLLSEKKYIKQRYKAAFGYELDLTNPITLNEKINWLKLFERSDLHTQCADKYAVRSYVSKTIGDEYLTPLLIHTKNPKEIKPENLPDFPCIIKTNHDSGGGIFVYDKSAIDWNSVRKNLKKRLKKNYYWNSKEWQYKNIEPCIIVEKLLMDAQGNIPFDYKLHCLNGKVHMIQVDIGRGTENHFRNWYLSDWKRAPFKWSSSKGNGKYTDPCDEDVPKPSNLSKMIDLSESLAEPFTYVRVDWYNVDGRLFFGEITYHHDSGYRPILPREWDEKLGQKLKLPMEY